MASELQSEEKKAVQERLRMNNQFRRSIENKNSLSTITEEPKSFPTTTTSTGLGSLVGEFVTKGHLPRTVIMPFPKLPKPIPPRKQRHTSVVLRGSSREVVVPHEREKPRDVLVQEGILAHIATSGKDLFHTVIDDQPTTHRRAKSILITGQGLQNVRSLQEALKEDKHLKLKNLYQIDKNNMVSTTASPDTSLSMLSPTASSFGTQTDTSVSEKYSNKHNQQRIKYLMGLSDDEEEGDKVDDKELTDKAPVVVSESMRRAQKYLRVHQIFQFFQFITAHLLSALPENPIEFIIELMDKCLIYRTGFISPPLLYNKNHLECLFYLMDRMRTDFITLEQYKTGMHTIGICLYNAKPPITEGMVSKEFFIEEAYDCLINLLNDMIRCRYLDQYYSSSQSPPSFNMSFITNSGAENSNLIL